MLRGYFRRVEMEQTNLGKILYMIDTTKPRQRGAKVPRLDDYLPRKVTSPTSNLTLDERQKIARENASKLKDKFKKGVVYTEI